MNKNSTIMLILLTLVMAACGPTATLEQSIEPAAAEIAPTEASVPEVQTSNPVLDHILEILQTDFTGQPGERFPAVRLHGNPSVSQVSFHGQHDYNTGVPLYFSWDFASGGWGQNPDETIGFTIPEDMEPGTYTWEQVFGYEMDGIGKEVNFFITVTVE